MPQCNICAVFANSYQPWSLFEGVPDESQERVSTFAQSTSTRYYPYCTSFVKADHVVTQNPESSLFKYPEDCLHHATFTVVAAVASVISVARLHRVAALIVESAEHGSPPPPMLSYLLPLFCFLLSVAVFCQARYLAGDVQTPKWLFAGMLLGSTVGYADGADIIQFCLAYLPCTIALMLGLSWLVNMHAQQLKATFAARCCLLHLADSLAIPLGNMRDSDGAESVVSKSNDLLECGLQN